MTSDPRKVMEIATQSALNIERVIKKPAPACMVSAFGTSALEFEMWFWIRDPAAGIQNVKSDVLLALWDALEQDGARLWRPTPSRVIYEMADKPKGRAGGLLSNAKSKSR